MPRWVKWLLWFLLIICTLPVLLLLLLQTGPAQQLIRDKAENYLEDKLNTDVNIGRIRLVWFSQLRIDGFYVADRQHQPLLYSGSLSVRYDLFALFRNRLVIHDLNWDKILVNVYTTDKEKLNYQFILDSFVGDTSTVTAKDTSGTPLQFEIGRLKVSNLKLRYHDDVGGLHSVISLGSLGINIKDFEPPAGLYEFRAITLDRLAGFVTLDYKPEKQSDTASSTAPGSSAMLLKTKLLKIQQSSFMFTDASAGIRTGWSLPELQLKLASIDLGRAAIKMSSLEINSPIGFVAMKAPADTTAARIDSTGQNWVIQASDVRIAGGSIRFDDHTKPRTAYSHAFDYNHFLLSPLNLDISKLLYSDSLTSAELKQLNVRDQSGFEVKRGEARISFSDNGALLDNLLLETNESRIAKKLQIKVASWSALKNDLPSTAITADLDRTKLVLSEALYFIPEYRNNKNLRGVWNKQVDLNGKITGTLRQLTISGLHFRDNAGNDILASGTVTHVTDSKRLNASLASVNIQTGNRSIRSWVPEGTIPSSISLPDQLAITGSFAGGMTYANTSLSVRSSFGNAVFNGRLNNYSDKERSTYDLEVKSIDMNIGKWINDTSLGKLVARGKIKGQGFDYRKMKTDADVRIFSAQYGGYNYHDIDIKAQLNNGDYLANVISRDSNLAASVQLRGNVSDSFPTVAGAIKVDRVDLQAIGMSTSPFVMKGEFDVDLVNSKPRNLNGNFYATRIQVADGSNIYVLDSIQVKAKAESGVQRIDFASPFGWANITGDYDYTTMLADAITLVKKHVRSPDSATAAARTQRKQQADFFASLQWPKSLEELAPDLHMPRPFVVEGRLNTDSSLLVINGKLPFVRYGEFRIDSLALELKSDVDSLHGTLGLAQVRHPSLAVQRTVFSTGADNGNMHWELSLRDKKDSLKYLVAGNIRFLNENGYDIMLAQQLLLDKITFTTGENNVISFRKGTLEKAKLFLQSEQQKITIVTDSVAGSSFPPLLVKLENFRISTITNMLDQDTSLAEGLLNGEIRMVNQSGQSSVDANVRIDSLTVTGVTVGALDVKLTTPSQGQYQVNAKISGNGNDVNINGTYASVMDFTVQLNSLNLAAAEPFTMGQASKLSGAVNGNITVKGKPSTPEVRGQLNFNNASGNVTFLNSMLTLKNEALVFDESGIRFNNFTITDSLGGKAVIDGHVVTTDYSNFAFDLNVNTTDFRVLGPKLNDEQMFYGPAHIDSRIKISGNKDLPRINMSVKLLDKSNVTVVLPEEKMGIVSREGVIIFVDRDNPPDSSLLDGKVSDTLLNNELKGFAFSGDVEITKASTITIVIDRVNGDYLETKGAASLSLSIEPSSKMTLTGKYEIDEGKYEMSLNQLIKRTFTIDKGSSITWNGDPLKAEVDITAKHVVRASAIDLIGDQVTTVSENRNRLKQRVPVEVYLIIKDQLMKPEINFRLDMEEKDRNIFNGAMYTRLKQINNIPSQLNKQVMGLLILQTFIAEDPLNTFEGGGGGLGYEAKRSVSKILSQQLNNLAGNLIKGIDLTFDLQTQEDYSSGERSELTTLNVGASKTLFNDRLTVAIGSNIGIAGANASNASALIGDVSVDYALSRDGRYKMRAYQRNQTDAVLEGQIIETGLSFILVMDYDKFREIFQKAKKEQEAKKIK
ncbi:translocation/assembly module TamB domain-containing protein [Flavihumibacter solisilvae]|uniref:translocation/assembly module TamB domain-containing protein n=1 Tax=Flavihumibacter solisilvae TaxID=1349421 RepID=UPI00126A3723|nr:translocation/assembly module TamB domain-containing protein [Flavihumibacter solisilvae]